MAASASGIGGRPGRVRGGQRCDAKRCEAKRCEAVRSDAVTGSGRAGRQGGRAVRRGGGQGGGGSRAGKHTHGTPSPSLPLILRPLPRILGYTADIALLLSNFWHALTLILHAPRKLLSFSADIAPSRKTCGHIGIAVLI